MSDVLDVESHEEFLDLVATHTEVVVKFWATWCGPCKQLAPHFEAAAENCSAPFVAVDVDKAPWATVVYGVRGVPAVKLFRDGEFHTDLKSRKAVALLNEIINA